jgi:hypothetical protein
MHTIIKYFKKHNGPLPSYNALHPFHNEDHENELKYCLKSMESMKEHLKNKTLEISRVEEQNLRILQKLIKIKDGVIFTQRRFDSACRAFNK